MSTTLFHHLLPLTLPLGIMFALLSFLPSCTMKSDEPDMPRVMDRVILFYMGGDNNLSDEVLDKRIEILAGYNGLYNGKLLLYSDTYGQTPVLYEATDANGMPDWLEVDRYMEENSADPAVFARVIREVKERYPAESYGLVVFSHASGWLPQGALLRPKSVIIDGNNEMELRDLAAAIPDNQFEFIVFEACFMAGIEVAYELKDKTKYIIASSAEIVSPGFTPVYERLLPKLFHKTPDLRGVVQMYHTHCQARSGYRQSATLSLIKTDALDALAEFIKENIEMPETAYNISLYQAFDRYNHHLFFDFREYYSSLLTTETLKHELNQLIEACVPYKQATDWFMSGMNGFEINAHSGLTTYIPQENFPLLNEKHKQLSWRLRLTIDN